MVDDNSCYSPAKAIAAGRMLEDHGIGHLEEPCPYREVDQTAEVRAALSIDVAGGRQDCELTAWQLALEHKAVDILKPDIVYLWGKCRTLEVCRMGERARLPITPHAAHPGLVTLCTMHLLRAIPNAGKDLEFSSEGPDYYPWQEGLFLNDPYRIEDSHATVTDAPGRGVEINPDWLGRARHRVSERT